MREILFRGKTKSGEWGYGSYLKTSPTDNMSRGVHTDWIVESAGQNGGYVCLRKKYAVMPDTVGQYTEFKDSNGAKIFEGDILRCHYNCKDIKNTLCVCEQDKINPCFVLRNIKNEYDVEYDFVKCGLLDLEVIGNIYDNPELLKGE